MFQMCFGSNDDAPREKKDVRHWETKDLDKLADDWKRAKDAQAGVLAFDDWQIENDWGKHGIGPRDAMRAGWTKDVGDVQYIIEAYKDPSQHGFS